MKSCNILPYCSHCSCFVAAVSYLQMNLPFNNKILKYVQYLHYEKQNDSLSLNSISNLILKIASVFGSKAINVFNVSSGKTPTEIVDMVSVFIRLSGSYIRRKFLNQCTLLKSKMAVVMSLQLRLEINIGIMF